MVENCRIFASVLFAIAAVITASAQLLSLVNSSSPKPPITTEIKKPVAPPPPPIPEPAPPPPVLEPTKVNYTKLTNLLAAKNWRDADSETARVIFLAAGMEGERSLRLGDIENFPCKDLKTINDLWVHHSNGKFGFSIQRDIYHKVGREWLYTEIGWVSRETGRTMFWRDILPIQDWSPKGQLPLFLRNYYLRSIKERHGVFFSRMKTCGL